MKKNKLFFTIFSITIFFCVAVIFDVTPYLRGPAPYPPEWRWDYLFVNTMERIWAPLLVIGGYLLVIQKIEIMTEKKIIYFEKLILTTLVIISILIQFSILYFSRSGIAVLVGRIINPDMNGYFTAAMQIHDIQKFFTTYNTTVLSMPMHAQGHPPGAILFFWTMLQISKPFSPFFTPLQYIYFSHADVHMIWQRTSLVEKAVGLFSGPFICFLSACAIPLIYIIAKKEFGVRSAIRSAFIYCIIPSLVFFVPINDVFLPLFVLASFIFFQKGLEDRNYFFMTSSGFLFTLGIFFSLSLVPLGILFFIYAMLRKKGDILALFMPGVYFLLGFVSLPILLFFILHYNSYQVSQTLMSGLPEQRNYATWLFYNLYDFFIFAGIPVMYVGIYCFIRMISIKLNKNILSEQALSFGFFSMIIILNLSGSVRGEVARIWIPFYSFFVILVGHYLTKKLQWGKREFIGFICLQCLQLVVMQEFWVMLW